MKHLLLGLISILVFSCNFTDDVYYKVDPVVEDHVNQFFKEAEKRGVYMDRTNLIVMVSPHTKRFPSGAGRASEEGNQKVIFIWNEAVTHYEDSPEAIENIVFHELGHVLLLRGHTHEYSIMSSSLPIREYQGKPDVRKILIDELFN